MGCGASSQAVENVVLPSQDRYERKQLIGVGHHGRVYRCHYHLDQKDYALKVIDQLQTQAAFKLTRQSWTEHVEKLKSLRHESITSYFQIEFNQREISVVMEIAKEGTLKKFIQKNGKLTEEIAAKILESILEGLKFLHGEGVAHKDLKTNNVLMLNEEAVKVSDYALAELYDARLSDQNKMKVKAEIAYNRGDSLPYMAPEVIKNQGFSEKADVWSLGCILVEMMTGKIPWTNLGNTFEESFKTISAAVYPPFPTSISKQCKSFLQSCLSVSAVQRSTVKQLLSHKFIRNNSKKQTELEENDSVKLKIEKNDKANRVGSNNSDKKHEDLMKSPPSIERSGSKNQNNSNTIPRKFIARRADRVQARASRNSKAKEAKPHQQKLTRLKQVANSLGSLHNSKNLLQISKQQILPQIVQDDDDNMVMLNNKKVKLNPSFQHHKQSISKMKTDQSQWTEPQRQYRNSVQLQDLQDSRSKPINEKFRIKSKNGSVAYDPDKQPDKEMRMDTQPAISSSEFQQDKEYFKKPLKLLKKKLRDIKISNITKGSTSETNQSTTKVQLEKIYNEDKDSRDHKIRSITQASREEIVINTQLARAQRDRYINEQLVIKRQRQEEKAKWQQQLKSGAEIIKKQFSYRYAPAHTYLIASLQK